MSIRYRTKGFLIKKRDQGEADQVLTVYTKSFGKVIVLGKGIRKIHSKLKYGAGLFGLSEIEFIQGKKIKTLTDIGSLESFRGAKGSLEKLKVLAGMCALLDISTPQEERDEEIWRLMKDSFEGLDKGTFPFLVFQYFFWNLFKALGYHPSLYKCVCCQKKLISEEMYFDCGKGGVVCKECSEGEGSLIGTETIKLLRLFTKENLKELKRFKILKEHQENLDKMLREYFSYFKNSNNLLY
jgi:DNA repair protein RecO (recombination protein O)